MYKIVEDKDERMWGMLCHLSALAGFIIPFGNIIGPLIVYSMKKDEYSFVADQGKESLNFQISVLIYLAISLVTIVLLIGIMFLVIIPLISLILTVLASIRANDGEYYRYPFCIRFIK
ncbi:MAG TPA: DUF4870 domain-containing protein [Prolixibacteraceae bacterium]|nr:DUF4870 domain-containing protein [Prolixibacteraceae bacterium]